MVQKQPYLFEPYVNTTTTNNNNLFCLRVYISGFMFYSGCGAFYLLGY